MDNTAVKDNPANAPKDLEEFDPFQIGDVSSRGKTKGSKSPQSAASRTASAVNKASTALPPRMDVKFKLHEEVSSMADASGEDEGSSDIFVEGTAQVNSKHRTTGLDRISLIRLTFYYSRRK